MNECQKSSDQPLSRETIPIFVEKLTDMTATRPASYRSNENQNYFVEDGKTASRILQNPGGTSSISLAWGTTVGP